MMGIRHQRIDAGCPWQNGRVERFFGTLKEKPNYWDVANRQQLQAVFEMFRDCTLPPSSRPPPAKMAVRTDRIPNWTIEQDRALPIFAFEQDTGAISV